MKPNARILLGHGSGGRLSHELVTGVFIKKFENTVLAGLTDAAVLPLNAGKMAFTTDSFVVNPLFFPGADIGKLAVAGTVNDLAVSGAKPLYLSASFILEEGLELDILEKVTDSMAREARQAGIVIVTGDTKVVEKGKCDKLFINTAGIGIFDESHRPLPSHENISSGDKILINGTIGDHGMAVMAARNELNLQSAISSDCASLNSLIESLSAQNINIKFMRDATRGGLGTVLCELCENRSFGVLINEETLPVKEQVRGLCELLGFDPLYVANEGKVVLVVAENDAAKALEIMLKHELGADAAIIGEIVSDHPGKTWLKTAYGSTRMVDMLAGEQLPRIC